jgi:alpha-soluble NSF attachment protein
MRPTHSQRHSVHTCHSNSRLLTNIQPEAYRKDDPEAAARCLDKAIAHYCSKGNFRRAATHKQNLAELYEVELGDNARAGAAYEEAAGWYESVRSNPNHSMKT